MKSISSEDDRLSPWTTASRAWRRLRFPVEAAVEETDLATTIGTDGALIR